MMTLPRGDPSSVYHPLDRDWSQEQRTLCTQRSVSGKELKSSSASAMMGGAVLVDPVVVAIGVEECEQGAGKDCFSKLSSWSGSSVKPRAKRLVSFLNLDQGF